MTKTARREGGSTGRRQPALRRIAVVLGCSLAMLPALSSTVAFQDMTSLIEGDRAQARWQAYFIPSPAGAVEKATIAFGEAARSRMPAGAGIQAGNGDRYTLETILPAAESPDELRVSRNDKTGRVLAVTPQAPPKAFTAGSILERQSLLRPAAALGAELRTAFVRADAQADTIALAMNFEAARPSIVEPAAKVMVASLTTTADDTAGAVPGTNALGYGAAPGGNPVASLFEKILRPGPNGFIPPIGPKDHSWAATPLPAAAFSAKEQTCLANGIYFEARGESEEGQAAVAQVILNRVRNPTYPGTICGVVYQNKNWRNRCQFSFACDGIKDRITNKRAFSIAKRIAGEVTRGETWLAEVGSATHYHATYVAPRWAKSMKKVDTVGRHVFYRTYNGGWG